MNQTILQKHQYSIYQGSDGRWRTYIIVDNKRKLIARKNRKDIEELLSELYKVDTTATLTDIFEDWLEYKRLDVSEPTIRKYKDAWARHYEHEELIYTQIPAIKRIDIDAWANRQIDKYHLTRKAYTSMITVMRQMLDYAIDLEIIDHNPARDVRIRRGKLAPERKKPDAEQVFSMEELQQIKMLCYDDFRKNEYPVHCLIPLAVVFMFLTGLRVSEVCALQYDDIQDDTATIQRMYRHDTGEILDKTKGVFGSRTVPLPAEALGIMDKCKAKQTQRRIQTNYIFSMTQGPAYYQGICRAFYKYSQKVGIKRSTHKARKTYISTLIDAGVNINTVRQVAGHVDEITTYHSYIYDRSDENAKKQAIKDAISKADKSDSTLSKCP